MVPQTTKFSYVYDELKQRITDGQILPGSRLPSSRRLCDEFQVSLYTINNVLEALKEEGLIEDQPRLAPRVVLRKNMPHPENIVLSILKQRDGITQLYQTLVYIMPPLLTFASRGCDLEIMPHYGQAAEAAKAGMAAGGWRPPSALNRDILKSGGSPLIGDLYSTFELHSKLTFFTEQCSYFTEIFLKDNIFGTGALMDILKGQDSSVKYRQLTALYQRLSDSIAGTMKYLAGTVPKCPIQSPAPFSWNPTRGQDYCYARIVSDLNRKIGSGFYPRGTYLPYEKQLANQYRVSVSTVRKALAELEERGYVKKMNAKGTIVTEPDDSRVSQLLPNPRRTKEALRYLNSLQLLTLIIHPAALLAAERFTEKEIKELTEKFSRTDSIYLIDMFEAVLKHIELEPMRVILTEAFRLTEWGYYITYYTKKRRNILSLNDLVLTAHQYLCKGNAAAFADSMEECYRHVLERAKKIMVEEYIFYGAVYIRIPERSGWSGDGLHNC